MTGLPQARSVLGPHRPPEFASGVLARERAHRLHLLADPLLASVELEEQGRGHRVVEPRVAVDGIHLDLVEQLDPRHRHPALDGLDDGVDRAGESVERAHRGGHCLGDAVQAEPDLGDYPEGALGAHEQPGEVVAGGGLPCASAGSHDAPVGHHHREPQHILAHRPVAHRVRSRCTGRGHPAERCVGARVDGEEQAGVAQVLVELLSPHPRLDPAVEVLGVHLDDFVHSRHVDGDAAVQGLDMPFERRPGPERDHGAAVAGAQAHHLRHLLGALRKDHRVRRCGLVIGLVVAVLLAHRRGGGDTAGEQLVQLVHDRRDRLGGNAQQWLRQWLDRHEWYARRSGMSRATARNLRDDATSRSIPWIIRAASPSAPDGRAR